MEYCICIKLFLIAVSIYQKLK